MATSNQVTRMLMLISDPSSPKATFDDKSRDVHNNGQDLFNLPAVEALRLLSASVELLVRMTGDYPPTPPPTTVTYPQMSGLQVEKENIVRSQSQQNLARLRQQQAEATARPASAVAGAGAGDSSNVGMDASLAYSVSVSAQRQDATTDTTTQPGSEPMLAAEPQPVDGVQFKHHAPEPQPYIIVGEDSQPVNLQHGAITRKFYSKKEPPISINQYLARLHQFCPMSTAVYLATSLYIHRLAVEERAIPVTRRNAHRLVLAGLRVAMKVLEDLSYPHAKIAKVGGVSEVELARLEISFCFLAGFDLIVGEELLRSHWEELRGSKAQAVLKGTEVPTLKLARRPREVAPASG
ncbi:hypothetical protein E4U42_006305 [Claviceps africana]|uniref:PCL7 Cyclin like protein interacting with Pho85p n=1 Tax=Claviceps africana TaxID=83212 RepID=A0A8K0J4L1_9HYPO|nr:hypothetical protein E4U42_006305 [Claviceps africana]